MVKEWSNSGQTAGQTAGGELRPTLAGEGGQSGQKWSKNGQIVVKPLVTQGRRRRAKEASGDGGEITLWPYIGQALV